MKINLKGSNLALTPQIREYLDTRLAHLQKFLPEGDDASVIDVELGKPTNHHHTGDIFRAEINVNIGSRTFRAVSEQQDLFAAIDDMKDEIARELSSEKEKRISLVRRGGQKLKNLLRTFYK